ncbi:MAG TPA: tripartite tricarboxylate transporter substrate binding protein [Pseudorhodoferax sp.]|jgi:tripartite-type tricarboxylate transporter receptor subunit TctC|nr:tripartite tricarboxylate transporter substrate binding protein [Pseudorhodoferax sp.]
MPSRRPDLSVRRRGLRLAAGALLAACSGLLPGGAAMASDLFPSRPLKLIAPLAPGGTTDLVARVLAEHVGRKLGQAVVVENRPGAGGVIGSQAVANAPADGYTLLMGTIGTLAIAPAMNSQMPYDTDTAFEPVSLVTGSQFVLVTHPSVPAKDVASFMAYVRAKPGALSYGSAGSGSTPQLGMELLKSMAGLDIVHVPYKGSGPMVAALAGGEVQAGMPDLPSAIAFIKAGRLNAIALTGKTRAASLPEVPTLADSGVQGYELLVWLGILAPAGTPQPIVDKLNAAIVAALKEPEVLARLAAIDTTAFASTPAEFRSFIRSERSRWTPIVQQSTARMN